MKLNREGELSICTRLQLKTLRTVARKVVREVLSVQRNLRKNRCSIPYGTCLVLVGIVYKFIS